MDFEAVSEPLDRGIQVVSVRGDVDTTGLHLLTRTQRRLDSSGGRVAVVSANRGILRVFGLTGLDEVVAIYPSRAAALNGDSHH